MPPNRPIYQYTIARPHLICPHPLNQTIADHLHPVIMSGLILKAFSRTNNLGGLNTIVVVLIGMVPLSVPPYERAMILYRREAIVVSYLYIRTYAAVAKRKSGDCRIPYP